RRPLPRDGREDPFPRTVCGEGGGTTFAGEGGWSFADDRSVEGRLAHRSVPDRQGSRISRRTGGRVPRPGGRGLLVVRRGTRTGGGDVPGTASRQGRLARLRSGRRDRQAEQERPSAGRSEVRARGR